MTLIERMRAKLPEQYVEAAIANTQLKDRQRIDSKYAQITSIFSWRKTPEGFSF